MCIMGMDDSDNAFVYKPFDNDLDMMPMGLNISIHVSDDMKNIHNHKHWFN